MYPSDPKRHPQARPTAGVPGLPATRTGFQGFRPLTSSCTLSPNDIWDLKLPGLTNNLRVTMLVLTRETTGEACRLGGSPYDFAAIPWTRWMERLELKSINAVKSRLVRLEEMGLIEVLPGGQGPAGTTANRYRLRWAEVSGMPTQVFPAVLCDQARPMCRKHQTTDTPPTDTPPTDTPPTDTPPTDTPRVSVLTDSLYFQELESIGTTSKNQSINPSNLEINELIKKMTIELNYINTNKNQNQSINTPVPEPKEPTDRTVRPVLELSPWLKGDAPEPWPEPLLQGLGEILDAWRIPTIAQRSPWSGEGAWAILQAIRVKGRNLGNQGGTLWNALLQAGKGAFWLAQAGPLLRQVGWRMVPEDGTQAESSLRSQGGQRLAREGFSRLPLHGETLDLHQRIRAQACGRENEVKVYDGDYDPEEEKPMTQPCEEKVTPVEELSPELKAELRARIEAFREASRTLIHTPGLSNRPGFFDTCSRSWEGIGAVLEPVLPLRVVLQDERRAIAIRQRSQIKMNVVNALYQAVS